MRQRYATQPEKHAAELVAVIDAIADGLVIFGPGGEVRSLNEAAFRYVTGDAPSGAEGAMPAAGPVFVDGVQQSFCRFVHFFSSAAAAKP